MECEYTVACVDWLVLGDSMLTATRSVADAMEAVKQGSACVGCMVRARPTASHHAHVQLCSPATSLLPAQSDTHVVIAALKRATSELSSFQRKIFKIDDHMGIAASGLIGDGRVLSRYMRNECINHRRARLSAVRGK